MHPSPGFTQRLAPGRIGTLTIPNRIVMSPMGSNLAEANGHIGERITRYYEARAKGGVGLIIAIHLIGDCKGAGFIEGAMLDAAQTVPGL